MLLNAYAHFNKLPPEESPRDPSWDIRETRLRDGTLIQITSAAHAKDQSWDAYFHTYSVSVGAPGTTFIGDSHEAFQIEYGVTDEQDEREIFGHITLPQQVLKIGEGITLLNPKVGGTQIKFYDYKPAEAMTDWLDLLIAKNQYSEPPISISFSPSAKP